MKEPSGMTHYHSYLLRLWSGVSQTGKHCRAALVNPKTGEQIWFSSLEHLFDFLKDQTAILPQDPDIEEDK